ncbi:hypothetical protein K501DRAFT_275706 [Backusella circina FSU 941]|nr:hypothetical protein K501DRAFT_275706 [Backusella circina FSU 941]
MDKLPPELLHGIFAQLDLKQRLVCLLVCRSWWNVLDRYSLFCNVELKEEKDQFKKFMGKIKLLPDRAAQVEVLDIVLQTKTSLNRRELFNIFPNARVLRVKPQKVTAHSIFTFYGRPIEITHSRSRVEILSDIHHCDLASQLLYSNLGSRLKVLDLDFYERSDAITVLSQLKNLPVLKSLSLTRPKIKLENLEEIHKNVPSIQDLTLKWLKIRAGDMPSNIIPATSMVKLNFSYNNSGHLKDEVTHTQLYQYMFKKYANIMDIEYDDKWLSVFSSYVRKEIFLNGILDFYKLILPLKTEFTLFALPDDVDPFETADTMGSQIKQFHIWMCQGGTLFRYLSQSNQVKYIEKLDILDTNIDSFHFLKEMTALTTLIIKFNKPHPPPVYLASCLAACPPSLKNLDIICRGLVIEPFNTILDSIESLNVSCDDTLTSDLGSIISSCFPNVVRLVLKGMVTENINISLKSTRFQRATLSTSGTNKIKYCTHGLSFKYLHQIEPQHYLFDGGKKRQVQHEEIAHLPTLSVEFFTAKLIKIHTGVKICS